ncbi:class I SAM-dependent methyltransferase [Paracoccus homiensis]|uniref:class I SAM-dependent methyltransferase n=1 Tax=Paracoccus homiensis TaxID=364199 RepID=UPI00398CBAE1
MIFQQKLQQEFLKTAEGVRKGVLTIETPEGRIHRFGGVEPGPDATLILHDWRTIPALAARGDIGLTEAYRDGWCDTPDLEALLTLALLNEDVLDSYIYGRRIYGMAAQVLYLFNRNTRSGSRRNIAAHYDLGNDFYRLWLDPTMTYSSALYAPGDDLAGAQTRKYDRIIDALGTSSGRLLEIGCGWGGFAERALARGDFAPKGLTLSTEQAEYARNRLGTGAEIALQDYRDEQGKFDHIVSIEMFEAVGEKYWPTYFGKLGQALAQRGRAVVQVITVADHYFDRYRKGGDMIRSFIFPGGMLPAPQRFVAEANRAGLAVQDAFGFGRDYARTLREWLRRFDEQLPEIRKLGFDDRFVRVWRFYLAACAASFEVGRTDVVQYQLAHA